EREREGEGGERESALLRSSVWGAEVEDRSGSSSGGKKKRGSSRQDYFFFIYSLSVEVCPLWLTLDCSFILFFPSVLDKWTQADPCHSLSLGGLIYHTSSQRTTDTHTYARTRIHFALPCASQGSESHWSVTS
ncbi:hypothetical protein SRHO_G00084250, partial [Serrasalmus rhombeus]